MLRSFPDTQIGDEVRVPANLETQVLIKLWSGSSVSLRVLRVRDLKCHMVRKLSSWKDFLGCCIKRLEHNRGISPSEFAQRETFFISFS